jgi:AraC-like DNA-binding protein
MFIDKNISLGEKVILVAQSQNRAVYKMEEPSGEGLMTCYEIFPGVILMYNDFHMERCFSQVKPRTAMLCIDHCREGRLEWEMDSGNCVYQEAGSLQFDTRENHIKKFSCPLRHFHGITVSFFIEEAQSSISAAPGGFTADLYALREKFCPGGTPRTMGAGKTLGPIFEALYEAPEDIRFRLARIKLLELLLYLETIPAESGGEERPFFYKTQVDTIKAIERFMTSHPENRYTQEELAARFKISLTSMKRCFKGVYGSSIYTYMRAWRMNAAAVMLRRTNESVISIASDLGYDNPSKFAGAFREVIGKSPGDFRKLSV